jgi:hypothetical protein
MQVIALLLGDPQLTPLSVPPVVFVEIVTLLAVGAGPPPVHDSTAVTVAAEFCP